MPQNFRGNSTSSATLDKFIGEIPALPRIQLIYRGNIFYYTPPSAVAEPAAPTGPVVTLIYRGNTYQRRLHILPYRRPQAINWRWDTVSDRG